LSISQVQALFKAMDGGTPVRERDRVFFQLMYACGLRISEATGLRVRDVDFDRGMLRVIGKGDKERVLPLKPQVVEVLRSYIGDYNLDGWLFPGRGDDPVTFRNMEDRFKAYVQAAGLPQGTSPHALRHSIAVHYLLGNAPITFVQGLLGHSSLATTGVYTQLADEQLRQIALNTPTALDLGEGEDAVLREVRAGYETELAEWDALVADWVA
jgi:site-specific recombinase XerD